MLIMVAQRGHQPIQSGSIIFLQWRASENPWKILIRTMNNMWKPAMLRFHPDRIFACEAGPSTSLEHGGYPAGGFNPFP